LEAVRGLIGDKLDVDAVVFVVKAEPIGKSLVADDLEVDARLLILEVLRVLLLLCVQQVHLDLVRYRVLDLVPHDLNVLKKHHGLKSTMLHCLDSVLDTEADHLSVKVDLLEEFSDEFLLVDELHISQ